MSAKTKLTQQQIDRFYDYIWVRDLSKRWYDADMDPEVTDDEVVDAFNSLNIYCKNYKYEEMITIITKKTNRDHYYAN